MQKLFSILITSTFLFAIMSCQSTKMAATTINQNFSSDQIFSNQWYLTEMNNEPVTRGIIKTPFVVFEKGETIRFSGTGGCNNIFGSIELLNGNSIKFSPVGSTKMACPNDQYEAKFIDMLSGVTNWSIANASLILWNGKNIVARFEGQSTEGSSLKMPQEIIGSWDLTYISGKKIAFKGLFPDKIPLMIFTAEKNNEVNGNTGCNSFLSKILLLNDQGISIAQPLAMTMMACPGEGEKTFLQTLQLVNKYEVSNDKLTLFQNDIPLMIFAKSAKQ
ncbi:MAG: META domain-containing protein [Bacteroidota bacterium]